jgi:hypothetical protein
MRTIRNCFYSDIYTPHFAELPVRTWRSTSCHLAQYLMSAVKLGMHAELSAACTVCSVSAAHVNRSSDRTVTTQTDKTVNRGHSARCWVFLCPMVCAIPTRSHHQHIGVHQQRECSLYDQFMGTDIIVCGNSPRQTERRRKAHMHRKAVHLVILVYCWLRSPRHICATIKSQCSCGGSSSSSNRCRHRQNIYFRVSFADLFED